VPPEPPVPVRSKCAHVLPAVQSHY
jgi:hypothetical protein